MVKSAERALNIEELLSNIHSSKETMKKYQGKEPAAENRTVKKLKHMSKNLPVNMIIFIILFAALGTMVIMLKAEVSDFTGLKERVSANDSIFRMAVIENRLETSEKENAALKNELAEIKISLEAIRNTKRGGKSFAQR
jgi:hypothetical protein